MALVAYWGPQIILRGALGPAPLGPAVSDPIETRPFQKVLLCRIFRCCSTGGPTILGTLGPPLGIVAISDPIEKRPSPTCVTCRVGRCVKRLVHN